MTPQNHQNQDKIKSKNSTGIPLRRGKSCYSDWKSTNTVDANGIIDHTKTNQENMNRFYETRDINLSTLPVTEVICNQVSPIKKMLQEMDSVSSASKEESISSISTHDDSDTTSINKHRYNKPRSYTNIERAIFKSRKKHHPKSEHSENRRTLHRIMRDLDSVSSVPNEITTIKNLRGQVKFNCVYLENPTFENKTSTTSRNIVNSSCDSSSSSEEDLLIMNLDKRQKRFDEEMEKLMKEMNYSLKNGFG